MKTLAIANRKGGSGKTTSARALGAGLMKNGFSVLFVDLDSQCNLTNDLGADTNAPTVYEVLTGEATAADTIRHTDGGDIIPAAEILAAADITITGEGREYRLKEALHGLKYDYCIIDTPPALGEATVNALTAADSVIITAQADTYSLQGAGQLYRIIEQIRESSNPSLKIEGVLLTRYSARAILSRDMRENLQAMAKQMKTKVFETAIRENISIKEAQATHADIFTYAPKSNAAKDYSAIVDELIKGKGRKKRT